MRGLVQAEIGSACFVGDDVVVGTSAVPAELDGRDNLAPNMTVRWPTTQRRFLAPAKDFSGLSRVAVDQLGRRSVVTYGDPVIVVQRA